MVNATYDIPAVREVKPPAAPEFPKAADAIANQPPSMPYVPDTIDDFESEIVRHAEPMEETRARQQAAAPEPIETRASSVEISYDANDLEIPAFLRKRGDN
jgi:hypothetical protein